MACPSFVNTMPPMGSSNIFSIAFGPKHDRMMSATLFEVSIVCLPWVSKLGGAIDGAHVLAAVILESWAFLPVCLSPLWVSARNFVSIIKAEDELQKGT
jgi:hypothetical protein